MLKRGESSLDAVEAAVRVMEDDPHFNAGKGAAFTIAGTNELDAALMDGSTLPAGAVSGVMTTRNPISLARAVMEKTTHVMLAGPAADSFARKQGLEQVNPSYFRTPGSGRRFKTLIAGAAQAFCSTMPASAEWVRWGPSHAILQADLPPQPRPAADD